MGEPVQIAAGQPGVHSAPVDGQIVRQDLAGEGSPGQDQHHRHAPQERDTIRGGDPSPLMLSDAPHAENSPSRTSTAW